MKKDSSKNIVDLQNLGEIHLYLERNLKKESRGIVYRACGVGCHMWYYGMAVIAD